MPRSLFHDRQGVSEIVASLILILIVSTAGVVAYSYSLGAFSSSNSLLQLQTNQKEEQARERFSITAVWWNTTNQLNLTVLNYGKIDLTIDAVYINGTLASNYLSGKGVKTATWNLIQIKLISPMPIQNGQTYEIIAASTRGSKNAVFWKA